MARTWMYLAAGVLLCSALGAGPCRYQPPTAFPPAPVVFPRTPTLAEIQQDRNVRVRAVHQLQATGATLTVQGMPSLRADLSLEPTRHFRLGAGTTLTGQELDIGSNDELFWIWVRRNTPPVVYYCRHDQYAQSAARQVVPIEPGWLIEALGLVTFDSQYQHQGPFAAGAQRIEIRTLVPSPGGDLIKSTILHEQYGYVIEQKVLDAQQRLIASAVGSRHQYDVKTGVSLPRTVEINLPSMGLAFTLDVSEYVINGPLGDPAQLWAMPRFEGYQAIDLADPRLPRANGLAPGPVSTLTPSAAPPPGVIPSGPANPAGIAGPGPALVPVTPSGPAPNFAPIAPPVAAPFANPGVPATNPAEDQPPAQPWAPSPPSGPVYPSAARELPVYRGVTKQR